MDRINLTIGEIAKLAGVSKTTVSRVINNKPDVDRETRRRILALIEEHDYQPNVFAKAISSQKSCNIGLIIPYEADFVFSNPFFVELLEGISTAVDHSGYSLLVCYLHNQNYVDLYKQRKVDGFIVLSPGTLHRTLIDSLFEVGAPFVSTSKLADEQNMVYVDVDNFKGGVLATEHLISLGHKRIAYVGKPSLLSSKDRRDGYAASLKEHRIPYREELVIVAQDSGIRHGYDAVKSILRGRIHPTAIFLANDMMAIGAIKAIRESGKRVPEDMSIVGFDGLAIGDFFTPSLTTVRQPAFQKGKVAAEMLVRYLAGEEKPPSQILDIELVVRESSKPVT